MIYISLSKFLTFIKFRCENLGSTNSQMNFQVKEYSDQNLNSPFAEKFGGFWNRKLPIKLKIFKICKFENFLRECLVLGYCTLLQLQPFRNTTNNFGSNYKNSLDYNKKPTRSILISAEILSCTKKSKRDIFKIQITF